MVNLGTGLTYKQAGVDVDAGNRLVELIKPLCRMTKRRGADASIGGFSGILDIRATGFQDPLLLAATDGVGTKLRLALDTGLLDHIGVDLVAMCVNDIIVQGGEPLIFLDYYACGKLDPETAARIVAGIAKGCVEAGCALVGGETAEMPGLYANDDFDLAGFAVGAVERTDLIEQGRVMEKDMIIGLASSGAHSNGYSLIRKILSVASDRRKGEFDLMASPPWEATQAGPSLAELLLTPTRIYVKPLLSILKQFGTAIHGLCHITGGGFYDNIPRILPPDLAVRLERAAWPHNPLFSWLAEEGTVSDYEMHRSFNCGIGMVLAVAPSQANAILDSLRKLGETPYYLGEVTTLANAHGPQVDIVF